MRCKCNPSRAEFGDWRGVRRCTVCGKVFHAGWKCRPKCEPLTDDEFKAEVLPTAEAPRTQSQVSVEEACPPVCCDPIERDSRQEQATPEADYLSTAVEDCQTEEQLSCEDECLPECEQTAGEDFAPESEPPAEDSCPPQAEPLAQHGEWTRVLPPQGEEGALCWPLGNLTDQLPRDPH